MTNIFCLSVVVQSDSRSKEITVAMECFNSLLLKLREVHEREVEGKWNSEWKQQPKRETRMQLISFARIITRCVFGFQAGRGRSKSCPTRRAGEWLLHLPEVST